MREAVLLVASSSAPVPSRGSANLPNKTSPCKCAMKSVNISVCNVSENAPIVTMLPDHEVTAPLRGAAPLRLVAQLCLGNGTECGGGGGVQGGRAVSAAGG